jgi:hypothetical protein
MRMRMKKEKHVYFLFVSSVILLLIIIVMLFGSDTGELPRDIKSTRLSTWHS